jgi:hypothetical protein
MLELTGLIASLDGRVLLRTSRSGPEPALLGRAVARFLLDECGGVDLLVGAQ